MNDLTHISLFTGLGGFDLAAEWAGFRTIAMCEIEPFAQEVLKARFGAVADAESRPGQGDRENPILIPDIRDFDGRRFRGATLLTGGFPCQPFSHAGQRRGEADSRHLWPEMLRVIQEARPAWVIGENVAGIRSLESEQSGPDVESGPDDEAGGDTEYSVVLDRICGDLERIGYEVQPVIIPACAVGAPHRRDRVWIIANDTERERCKGCPGRPAAKPIRNREENGLPVPPDSDAPYPIGPGTGEGTLADPHTLCNASGGAHGEVRRGRKRGRKDSHQFGRDEVGSHASDHDSDAQHARVPPAHILAAQDDERGPLPVGEPDSDAPDAYESGLSDWAGEHRGEPASCGTRECGNGRCGSIQTGWDIPWIEVATRFCRVDDGLPAVLDSTGGLNADGIRILHEGESEDTDRSAMRPVRANQKASKASPGRRCQLGLCADSLPKMPCKDSLRKWHLGAREAGDGRMCGLWSAVLSTMEENQTWEGGDLWPGMSEDIRKIMCLEKMGKNRVARLKALGNAIVPAVADEIVRLIAEIEKNA